MEHHVYRFLFARQYTRPARIGEKALAVPPSPQNYHHMNRGKIKHLNHKNPTKVLQRKQLAILGFDFYIEKYTMAAGGQRTQKVGWVQAERQPVAMLALFHLGTGF